MPDAQTWAAFVATSVLLVMVPGPSMMFLLAEGLRGGPANAFRAALGVETATVLFVIATAGGLAAVINTTAWAFAVVKYGGAMYLVWLGVQALRRRDHEPPRGSSRPAAGTYRRGLLVGLSNVKVSLFFVAFFPQFIRAGQGPAAVQVLALGTVFVAIAIAFDCVYSMASGGLGRLLRRRPRWARGQQQLSGGIYIGLGAWTALGGQHSR
jgi:threonine/homoserine/homoserine lactone efflux protein